MKLFEKVLGHIDQTTMYRTVLYSLVGLTVWSILLAFVGLLDQNPLSMIVSLTVLVGAGFAVDRSIAYVQNVRPNTESIFITALILFFLLTPSTDAQKLVILGLIAGIAAVSKYLLVWKKRHIFNPAAIAVVISGFAGIGYASWWVATPILLPFILLLGSIVVYKTRRYDMVGYYVGAAFLTIAITTLIGGDFSIAHLWLAVTSYPILFLALYMLTEPLTLAPTKRQRNSIAAVIGFVSYAGIGLGSFAVSPEIGLVLGNIAAFIVGRKQGVDLTLIGRKQLAGGQVEYLWKPSKQLHFQAGQYIELHIAHTKADMRGLRRIFTIASSPTSELVRTITRHSHKSSTYKKTLVKLPIATTARVTNIGGDFVLPDNQDTPLLFIANGVGVTPFISHLEWLAEQHETRNVTLIYAVSDPSDALIHLIPDKYHKHTIVHHGKLQTKTIQKYATDVNKREVYVSGSPQFVKAVTTSLSACDVSHIHKDYFAGY